MRLHPQFHAGDRADQLAVRLPDVLRSADGAARRRGAVPDRLVRRVADDAGAGDLRHPHARQSVQKRRASPAGRDLVPVVALGALLPFTPVGAYFGFVAPPPEFYLILAGWWWPICVLVETAKRYFYRRFNSQLTHGEHGRTLDAGPRAGARVPRSPDRAGKVVTVVLTGTCGASARNSMPSRRVRLATETTRRSPHSRCRTETTECRSCGCRRRRPCRPWR